MQKEQQYLKPIRCFLEDVGYNYIPAPGRFLFTEEWFLSATEFDDNGFAIVESFSRKKMKVDKNGNICEIIP